MSSFKDAAAFGSFSTNDIAEARRFYGEVLGVTVEAMPLPGLDGMLELRFGETRFMVYEKPDHAPASHTVLNLEVDDLDAAVAELKEHGVALEQTAFTGEDGIGRDPDGVMSPMAWIRDPAGNWIALSEFTSDA